MSKDRSGEAFDRLRAADPGAGLEPDHAALRRAVTARGDVVDELAGRRRRPARALQVAAASAGALAIGVSGFALGGGFATSIVASGEADSSGGGEAAPAIRLDSGGAGVAESPAMSPEAMPEPGFRAGGGAAGGSVSMAASDAAFMPHFGRLVFSQSGLSSSGTSATAYGYDAAAAHSEDALRSLAEALGVTGEVREEYGGLMIGSYDSGEPVVSLYADGTASFYFSDPTKDLWFCEPSGVECEERDLGDAPQGDDAVEQALDVLVALVLDAADFELEASDEADYGSADYSNVNAFRVVDGQRTGDMWGISFTGGGAQSVWGPTAGLVDLGQYDVISPAQAVERLNDPRFGASGSVYPPGWVGPARTLDGGAEPSAPRTLGSGDAFDWPVDSVTITSERLGLAQHHLGDGAVALVPSYELSADDGRTWSVIAVADELLDFSPVGLG